MKYKSFEIEKIGGLIRINMGNSTFYLLPEQFQKLLTKMKEYVF